MGINKYDWRLSPKFEDRDDLVQWLNDHKIKHFKLMYVHGVGARVIYKPSYTNKAV
jgi:hypothetical protein